MLEIEIEFAVTVFAVPTFLSLKVGVLEIVSTSPETLSSEYVTEAAVDWSYVLFDAVIVMVSVRLVMLAVVVVEVFCV